MRFRAKNDRGPRSAIVPSRGAILIGRSGGLVDVEIDHPAVSLRHAKVFRRAARTLVRDLGSSSGTFVDGCRVVGEVELAPGGSLAVGPVCFEYDGLRLVEPTQPISGTAVACIDVCRFIDRGGDAGTRVALLQEVSLAIQPGELVCLIGPSGSGKSTLLSILAGRQGPDRGHVLVRGRDLHVEFASVKHDLAFVPQTEALHQALTVRQALRFSAALRLPADTAREELDALVTNLLRDVGLEERGDTRIRDLSGGQRKRVSLATEIAHRPGTLLIDEVTSGLDEQGDLEIMSLIRSLTGSGIAVVCITHNTLNIERTAHRVVVLSSEGRLACCGTPDEVRRYFGIARLGDVYGILNSRSPADWQSRFRHSILWKRHVGCLLPAHTRTRGPYATPRPSAKDAVESILPPSGRRSGFLRQAALLTRRLTVIQRMDPRPLCMAIAQAVFVAALLAAFFGDLEGEVDPVKRIIDNRNAAFLLLISAFWLGCNNAAPEIARERPLFEQERAIAVRPLPYYCSKLLVLGTMATAQAIVVFTSMAWLNHLPGDGGAAGLARRIAIVAGAALLGTKLGLAISALSRSEQVAVRAVPMLMIPQIVLADVLSPLSGLLCWIGPMATSTYWTFRAFIGDMSAYQTHGSTTSPLAWTIAAMASHAAVAAMLTMWGLKRRATP